jgi:proline dehydrogenase
MSVLRNVFLAASESRLLRERAVQVPFVRRAVSKFMPGEKVDDALAASRALGVGTVLTRLGENLRGADEAEGVARHYLDLYDRVRAEELDVEISVKPTQLGLDFTREECERHLTELAERARATGNWLWIDMESTAYTEVTVDLYRRLRARFPNTGLCVQSYLYRTAADVERLIAAGAGVRLVKGAYKEPPSVAFQQKADVDAAYLRQMRLLMDHGVYPAIATHDEKIIAETRDYAAERKIGSDRYEFQMLYGIRRDLQASLTREGFGVRIYIPFGREWFPYFMRRLGERPANVGFVIRSLLQEG